MGESRRSGQSELHPVTMSGEEINYGQVSNTRIVLTKDGNVEVI